MPETLFFTVATGLYKVFVVPYIYFANKHNPGSKFEIIVDSVDSFIEENKQAYALLLNHCDILLRDNINLPFNTNANSIRFLTQPLTRAEYVYIGDIDILITSNVYKVHEHVFKAGLPYSNLIRPCNTRLTGLHYAKYDSQYPLLNLDQFKHITDDEMLLFEIMKSKSLIYSDSTYKEVIKTRPLCGIHMSMNRFPFFDNGLKVGWGVSYSDMQYMNELSESHLDFFTRHCNKYVRNVMSNIFFLASGVCALGEERFNQLTR